MINNLAEKAKQLKALEKGRGIDYILKEAYRILGNPLVMFDRSYNLLACIEDITTDDPLWIEITTQGTFSLEAVNFIITENFVNDFEQSKTVSLMKSDKLKYDRAVGKLIDDNGDRIANILILACLKPFEEGDMELIEFLSEILAAEIQHSEFYQKISRIHDGNLPNYLIEETPENHVFVREKLSELYDKLKTNLYLIVVDITSYEHTLTHLAYFRDQLRKLHPEHKYYVHLNNIVIIVSTDNVCLSIKKDLHYLNDFFVKYGVYAGISSSFQDLMEFRKYYREAICALNYGLENLRKRHVFKYDDIRIEHFLNSVKNAFDINKVYSPIIFTLQKYDKENDTSLLELLYTYLLYGKETRPTCEHMGITLEELSFQLKKLQDVFQIEWENGDMLCNLLLSIKLLDRLQKNQTPAKQSVLYAGSFSHTHRSKSL